MRFKLPKEDFPQALEWAKKATDVMAARGRLPLITLYVEVKEATGDVDIVAPDFMYGMIRRQPVAAKVFIMACVEAYLDEICRPPDDQENLERIDLKEPS